MLLQEMQHRVANSLQIIASILLMKANTVTSEETRQHLQDAHRRVMSIATLQEHIQLAGRGDVVHIRSYLSKLCTSLTSSMIGDSIPISLQVVCDNGMTLSAHAVSIGLIVMELVINALKYAFPQDHPDARVLVSYETFGTDWRLVVSDNGIGSSAAAVAKGGLGTTLVKALAQQLDAQVETMPAPAGTTIAITHATFAAKLPQIT
jgi:chemotaxis protein methyltransferase CheR